MANPNYVYLNVHGFNLSAKKGCDCLSLGRSDLETIASTIDFSDIELRLGRGHIKSEKRRMISILEELSEGKLREVAQSFVPENNRIN